jgi:hypothetical protein
MPVTLLNSYGLAQMDADGTPPGAGTTPPAPGGVLLTMFETAWLRLYWLYANVLETVDTPQRAVADRVVAKLTPYLQSGRIVGRSDRPRSIVAPSRNITKTEIGDGAVGEPRRVEMHRAAEAKMRRI